MEDLMEKLENAKAGKGHEGGTGDESRLAQHPRPSGHSCSAAVVHLMISLIHLIVTSAGMRSVLLRTLNSSRSMTS
jgi:hypothetical protein